MKRQVTMEEISDGKLYTSNDLVKADCGDCEGCHACCTGWEARLCWIRWILSGSAGEQERLLKLCLQERLN